MINEICEALELSSDSESSESDDDKSASGSSDTEAEQMMSLSAAATSGTTGKRTMRLLGHIGNKQILILIDSGSSGNFINQELVNQLQLPTQKLSTVQVTLADGKFMASDRGVPALKWGERRELALARDPA